MVKILPYLFVLALVIVTALVIAPPTAQGQIFVPLVGRLIVATTPTLQATIAVTSTGTITPTATLRPTPTPSFTPSITPTPTNSPTITPTPTKTSIPTTTPTITPTPTDTIGDGVIVLNDHFAYVSDEGKVTVVGEVRNDTDTNATNMIVRVTLYNNHKEVIDALNTYVWLDVLKPKDKTCFEAVFLGNPTFNEYGFETVYINTLDEPRSLEIMSQGAVYLQEEGAWNVFGQIHNAGDVASGENVLVYPQIIGTLYDKVGHVVDCTYVSSLADKLAPGESSIWEMAFRPIPQELADMYRVQPK
jgi:hypothetical protein